MESDPDEQTHPGVEDLTWTDKMAESYKGVKPGAKYTKLSEHARALISGEKQCSMFCGGKKCKYCRPDHWKPEQMCVKGIFSHWVTENILAMARPSTSIMKKFKIIEEFKKLGILSVVNLQTPGEHAACGYGLNPSGFSYDPQKFMKENIFFYNFGWPDYGVASLSTILDMVKVMQFALSQGKVAVHCHAGLGRTGVIIACYLVYTNRMSAEDAIHYVRSQRPGSIQTRGQMRCVREFQMYLHPFWIVFASRLVMNQKNKRTVDSHEFSLQQYLNRQRHLLHGYEGRKLKHLPKIIYVISERLLELALSTEANLDIQKEMHEVLIQDELPRAFGNYPKSFNERDTEGPITSVASVRKKARLVRKKSVSMETLNDETLKNVLGEDDNVSYNSSLEKLSSNSVSSSETDFEPEPAHDKFPAKSEEDDDNCIVYGQTRTIHVNTKSTTNDNNQLDADEVDASEKELHDTQTDNLNEKMSQVQISEAPSGESAKIVADALTLLDYDQMTKKKAEEYELSLNISHSAWVDLSKEMDPFVLSVIFWDWLDQLKEPILRVQDLTIIYSEFDDPETVLQKLEKGTRQVILYCAEVLVKLQPIDMEVEKRIQARLLSHFTQQRISLHSVEITSQTSRCSSLEEEREDWGEMKPDEARMLMKFFNNLMTFLYTK